MMFWQKLQDATNPAVSRTKVHGVIDFLTGCERRILNGQKLKWDPVTGAAIIPEGLTSDDIAIKGGKAIRVPPNCELKVIIGTSHWYREAYGKPEFVEHRLLIEGILKTRKNWVHERLTDLDEAWYEMRAVKHAWEKYRANLKEPERIQAILGVGSGSTQYSSISLDLVEKFFEGKKLGYEEERREREKKASEKSGVTRLLLDKPLSFFAKCMTWLKGQPDDILSEQEKAFRKHLEVVENLRGEKAFAPNLLGVGNKIGTDILNEAIKQAPPDYYPTLDIIEKRYEEPVKKWTAATFKYEAAPEGAVEKGGGVSSVLPCLKGSEQICDKDDTAEQKESVRKMPRLEGQIVIAISANHYAAQAAELVGAGTKNPGEAPPSETMLVKDAIEAFKKKVKELVEAMPGLVNDGETQDLKKAKTNAKTISNLMYLSIL